MFKAIESIHPADNRHVLALFDHDQKGIKMFDTLSANFKVLPGKSYEKRHSNGYAVALTLAVADSSLLAVDAKNLCIEYLFDNDVLDIQDINGHGLIFKDFKDDLLVTASGKKLQLTQAQQQELFENVANSIGDLRAYRTIRDGKKVFAEGIVPNLGVEKFGRFRVLFDRITTALGIWS